MSKEAMAAKGFGSVMASRQEREDFVYLAKLDEQAERYDEMVGAMKKVVNLGVDLTAEERNLLSVGYKNVVGARRAGEEAKGYENRVRNIKEYRQKVEFSSICTEIFGLIDELLIPSASAVESSVFYYNMKADYYRYLAEFKAGNDKKEEAAEQPFKAYEAVTKVSEADLAPSHPVRLGLALNFCVFYYEIVNSPERVCHLAKQAFDEAIAELDTLSEESDKDSTLIIQLLRDNLTLWTSDIPEDGATDDVKENNRKPGTIEDAEPERTQSLPNIFVPKEVANLYCISRNSLGMQLGGPCLHNLFSSLTAAKQLFFINLKYCFDELQ